VLEDWKWKAMNDVVQGRKPFTDRMKYVFFPQFGKTEEKEDLSNYTRLSNMNAIYTTLLKSCQYFQPQIWG